MAVERVPATASLIDLLDRVLDRGVVMDPWRRGTPVGIDLRERAVEATLEPKDGRTRGRARGPRATSGERNRRQTAEK
jgi:hypothetical protein